MASYTVLFLDKGGRTDRARTIEAESDAAAVRLAAAFGHALGVEVWSGGRIVGRALAPKAVRPVRRRSER